MLSLILIGQVTLQWDRREGMMEVRVMNHHQRSLTMVAEEVLEVEVVEVVVEAEEGLVVDIITTAVQCWL